jgi:hypothetical protein
MTDATHPALSTADSAAGHATQSQPQHRDPHHDEDDRPVPLLESQLEEDFNARWTDIQVKFVDDPRSAVEEADSLVAELMKRIAEMFASERSDLEAQWVQQGDVKPNTEDLQLALQHYRSFFYRLLSL